MEWNKECPACKEGFERFEDVIEVCEGSYRIYHKYCVELYPSGYVVFLDGEYLGESENEDGSCVSDYIWEDDEK